MAENSGKLSLLLLLNGGVAFAASLPAVPDLGREMPRKRLMKLQEKPTCMAWFKADLPDSLPPELTSEPGSYFDLVTC